MFLFSQRKYHFVLHLVGIVLLGGLLYSHTLNAPFHLDDAVCIVDNYTIRNLSDIPMIWKGILPYPSRFVGFYSFALNYHFHGLNVAGYHFVNICIHLVSSCLVYGIIFLLVKMLQQNQGRESWVAFYAALIFVSHPLQTQAVTYIAQRFESLASMFYLMAIFFYLLIKKTSSKKIKIFCGLGVFLSGLLGALTKEIVITLPGMMGFLAFLLAQQENVKPRLEKNDKWGYVFLIAFVCTFALILPFVFSFKIKQMLFVPRISASHAGDILTFNRYLLTQIRVFATFVRLFFLPFDQNLDYDFPMSNHFGEGKTLLSFFFLSGVIFVAIKSRKKSPLVLLGIFWFFIALSANLVPRRHVIFEHKMYLPSVGFCLCVAVFLENCIKEKTRIIFTLLGILFVLGSLTVRRNQLWCSGVALWQDVVSKSPQKSRPYSSLGVALSDQGKYEDAIREYNMALSINPQNANTYFNRAYAFERLGDTERALHDYSQSIELDKFFVKAYHNRAIIWENKGEYSKALKDYSEAIRLNDRYAIGYVHRANVYSLLGQYDLALKDYSSAIENDPKYSMAFFNRGVAYMVSRNDTAAIQDFQQTLRLNPKFTPAQKYLDQIRCMQGDQERCRSLSLE